MPSCEFEVVTIRRWWHSQVCFQHVCSYCRHFFFVSFQSWERISNDKTMLLSPNRNATWFSELMNLRRGTKSSSSMLGWRRNAVLLGISCCSLNSCGQLHTLQDTDKIAVEFGRVKPMEQWRCVAASCIRIHEHCKWQIRPWRVKGQSETVLLLCVIDWIPICWQGHC